VGRVCFCALTRCLLIRVSPRIPDAFLDRALPMDRGSYVQSFSVSGGTGCYMELKNMAFGLLSLRHGT